MIRLSEVKKGDIVNARFEDVINTGEVEQVDREEKKALVAHGDQEFWYDIADLTPVPLTWEILEKLGFHSTDDPVIKGTGTAYVRGPFIVQFPETANLHKIHLIYRDEHRDLHEELYVHQLQNHYQSMTNMHLGLE
ncbi:MAG: hypothetical protein KF746_28405 [Chitinophagaceae bacterium]|nr:hypothetical protein [Chitinophagaceae bacterium]